MNPYSKEISSLIDSFVTNRQCMRSRHIGDRQGMLDYILTPKVKIMLEGLTILWHSEVSYIPLD